MNQQQKEVQQALLDNEKEVLEALKKNYEEALLEINSNLNYLMARQDADMQHVIYQAEYQKALKDQVEGILNQLNNNEFETVSEYLTQCYEEGFVGTMYDLQAQGIPLVFPIDQEKVVQAIQHDTKLSTSLYAAFDMKDLKKKISSEISRGISNAVTYNEIARNISGHADINLNKAMRIARTEGHRINIKSAMDAQQKAREKGADIVKQWDASLDGKTRPHHRELDGQIKELDEDFVYSGGTVSAPAYFGDPSEDCNCRCALLQRARWALGEDITKYSPDAVEEISDDGVTKLFKIKADDYESFKKEYFKKLDEKKASERVRRNAQKMNSPKNDGKSSVIKTIKLDDITNAISGSNIKESVAQEIADILDKNGASWLFDTVSKVNKGNRIVFETDPIKVGTFFDISFNINEDLIGGMSVEQIDELFAKSGNTVANSLKDAIMHEVYHAKLIEGLNYAQLENLYEELEGIHIEGFSKIAYNDGAECIAEVGVLIERGEIDSVPEKALELFDKYMRNK